MRVLKDVCSVCCLSRMTVESLQQSVLHTHTVFHECRILLQVKVNNHIRNTANHWISKFNYPSWIYKWINRYNLGMYRSDFFALESLWFSTGHCIISAILAVMFCAFALSWDILGLSKVCLVVFGVCRINTSTNCPKYISADLPHPRRQSYLKTSCTADAFSPDR